MKSKSRSRSEYAALLITAIASLPFFVGNASAPGINEVDKTYTPITLSPASQNPIEANLAGGVIDFVMTEEQCGTTTLRIATDTDRIDTVLLYAELTIDKPSKNIASITTHNTMLAVDEQIAIATNGKFIAALANQNLGACGGPGCAPGQLHCDGQRFTGDYTLRLYDVDTQVLTNTGVTAEFHPPMCGAPDIAIPTGLSPMFVIGSNLLAFFSKDNAAFTNFGCPPFPARDFNMDGDTNDRVLRYIDLNGSLTTVVVGPTVSQAYANDTADTALLGTDGSRVAYSVLESYM